jgi:hypothetical protein
MATLVKKDDIWKVKFCFLPLGLEYFKTIKRGGLFSPVLLGAPGGEGGEARHEEVEAREGNHVDRQLTQVSVQLTGEPAAYYSSKDVRGSAGLIYKTISAPRNLTENYPCKHRTNLCTCKDDISNQLYLPEASGDAGHGEGDQMVQVTIGGSSQLQGSERKQEGQDL